MADIFKSIRNTVSANNQKINSSDIIELTEPIADNQQNKILNNIDDNNQITSESNSNNDLYDDAREDTNNNINYYQQKINKLHTNKNNNSNTTDNNNSILSTNSVKETTNEISSLLRTINNKRGKKINKGTTIEDLVIEAVKPYLANWMNDNLPELVKNIVEQEIKKLILEDL